MSALTVDGRRFYPTTMGYVPSVSTVLRRTFPGPVAQDEAQEADWDAKRDRGTQVHELIAQGYVESDVYAHLPDDIQYALIARQRFAWDWRFKQRDSEIELASSEMGYGGKPDADGMVRPRTFLGSRICGRILADWKTGRLHTAYIRRQLGAYYGLYVERYPRRNLVGAIGVGLDCATGAYTAIAIPRDELILEHQAFMQTLKQIQEEETCPILN